MTDFTLPKSLQDENLPHSIKNLTLEEKKQLAHDIRQTIIQVVAKNGGHLAPSLGVVELTLALLTVFDASKDHIIWDVGHQCYPWKLLTKRAKRFHTLRQLHGIAGFPKISESPEFDRFAGGHASISISAGLGMAMARDLNGTDENVISVIGDGALTGGMAFEALNQAGGLNKRMIVVLNDNGMSISHNVGALSQFLSRNLAHKNFLNFKEATGDFLKRIPKIGETLYNIADKGEKSFKTFFTQGMIFEALGFNYIGPIDGNNLEELIRHLEIAKEAEKPILLHIRTKKGLGYPPAENNPSRFHRVPGFEPETGLVPTPTINAEQGPGFTKIFGASLCELASQDKKIVAVCAAMPDGTGLGEFRSRFPDRFIDVGICEEHAVTFAAGMATRGLKPVVCIYSTFLQRAYDQLIHDVCLQNLPVVFCLDRAGLVGEDGASHHGVFDLTYLRSIPHMKVLAPRDESDLPDCLYTALQLGSPVAIRYPAMPTHAKIAPHAEYKLLETGKGEMLVEAEKKDVCVVAVGHRVHTCKDAIKSLTKYHNISLFDARWVSPVPRTQLTELVQTYKGIIFVEENCRAGGFSSACLEFLADTELLSSCKILRLGVPADDFAEHGPVEELRKVYGLDFESLAKQFAEFADNLQ